MQIVCLFIFMRQYIKFLKCLKPGVLLLLSAMLCLASCAGRNGYVRIQGYAQGGTYTVTVNLDGVDVSPEELKDSLDAILGRIDFTLSGYNRNSLLSRLNEGGEVELNEMFADIYGRSREVFDQTGGAVDVGSAPLYDMWGFGFRSGEMPSASQVDSVKAFSGMEHLRVSVSDLVGKKVTSEDLCPGLPGQPGPRLNFNAIAQGYSCDLIASYLYSLGVRDMMVNIGEIFCDGVNPSGKPWTVGVDRPEDGNDVPGAQLQGVFAVPEGPRGVVTSGNYRKFYIRDGRKYAHTIDPRSGYPVDHNLLSATIIAADATLADAYATYCMVVGLEEAKAFVESRQDLEGFLVYDEAGEFKTWCSEGLESHRVQ